MTKPPPRDLLALRDHAQQMAHEPAPTASERALWAQIADEIDTFLEQQTIQQDDLFQETQ